MAKENLYKKSFEIINEFFLINSSSDDFEKKIFETLKKIIDFHSGYIFFVNPEQIRVEYSYNSILQKKMYEISQELSQKLFKGRYDNSLTDILSLKSSFLAEPLSLKGHTYGFILLTADTFDNDTKQIFKSCSAIISNLIKDSEISKIISLQVKALQEGITDIQHENQKILEADKIKNDFLANISHELRTPLNSIIGFSELLSNEFAGALNEKQKEYLKDIQISGLHLLGMINEVLDISKLEANAAKLNKRDFSMEQAVNEVCNIVRPLAQKKNIDIFTDIEESTFNADYQKIQQILFNLVSNAIKFTPDNGEINILSYKDEHNLVIKIQDNGIGIEKKYHKKIFDKFVQIENKSVKNESSTGLGLTITKELIKMHNGKIEVESIPQNGSTFTIYLPF